MGPDRELSKWSNNPFAYGQLQGYLSKAKNNRVPIIAVLRIAPTNKDTIRASCVGILPPM